MNRHISYWLIATTLCVVGFSSPLFSSPSWEGVNTKSITEDAFTHEVEYDQDGFFKRLSLEGVVFSVDAPGNGTLRIVAEAGGEPIVQDQQIDGKVTGDEVEDLNGDGLPEVLVYLSSGYQNYGKVIGYSMYSKSSMGQIYFPGVANNSSANRGYAGGDEFALVENRLVQRFPVYRNGSRTGQMRQVQWKMVRGENTPAFQIDSVNEYGGGQSGNQRYNQSSFDKRMSLEGVTFHVSTMRNGMLQIVADAGGEPLVQERAIDGQITGAEVEDLNGDGSPEVFVYLSKGDRDPGEVIAYSMLGRSSMVPVYFPGIANNSSANRGYMGEDEFAVVENRLIQRFPIYQYGRRTGKTRQVQWKMVPGENSPVFQVDRISEY